MICTKGGLFTQNGARSSTIPGKPMLKLRGWARGAEELANPEKKLVLLFSFLKKKSDTVSIYNIVNLYYISILNICIIWQYDIYYY